MTDDAVIRATADRAEAEYDWRTTDVPSLIVSTVAELSGEDPNDLEPLHTRIDTDALDVLFRPVEDGPTRVGGLVEIPFDDYFVTVHAEGRIVVRPQNAAAD